MVKRNTLRNIKLTLLSLLFFFSTISVAKIDFNQPSDSIRIIESVSESPPKIYIGKKKDNILMVNHINLFADSIQCTLPDTLPFYDWITDDIHFKKFDFSKIQDTLIIVLNDSTDHFTAPFKGEITSEFGKRKWRYHYGIDIDLNRGDSVKVAFTGKVRVSTYSKTYGHVVVVRHHNGLETLYAHLSKRLVDVDSVITTGTIIGLGGNTGRSYGSHLHFEVRYFDEALDPRDLIAFEDFKTHNDVFTISQCNFQYKDELKIMSAIKYHRVRSGNTLSHIAIKYGTTINNLCRLNGISRNSILQIGQRIRVR